jgi:hypothetical protein
VTCKQWVEEDPTTFIMFNSAGWGAPGTAPAAGATPSQEDIMRKMQEEIARQMAQGGNNTNTPAMPEGMAGLTQE